MGVGGDETSLAKSNAVRWEEISETTFDKAVSVLLSRLHPLARRVDGAGGDGGKDVYFPTDNGPEIFQLKSFTGRMGPTQRKQVKRSLERASEEHPAAWHLVVPIDPTPKEEAWFEALTEDYEFPCDWLGRTWLDSELAKRPDIVRYFVHGGAEEVLRALRELNKEQAALGRGVPDAMDRAGALAKRLQDIDPHYAFSLAVDPDGTTSVAILPKYHGAEVDSPITISTTFHFPDTEEGRKVLDAVQEAMDFGQGVEIDIFRMDQGVDLAEAQQCVAWPEA